VKEQKAVYEAKEKTLMERLEQEGIEKAGGRKASVSISTSTVGQVENWDELYRYISRNKAFHLLERRLSNGAYRELLVQRAKLGVPGVVPYMKKRISLKVN
jgi:ribosomal protein S4